MDISEIVLKTPAVKSVTSFIKQDPVLVISAGLAVGSMFFVHPSVSYFGYLDCKTLSLLFCLMVVVAGWQKAGLFHDIAGKLLANTSNSRNLVVALVSLCFFASMFITNDVALITFVPFSVLVLREAGKQNLLIYTVVLQTIAANLGSMLLPIGNPQNLYLYEVSHLSLLGFIKLMLPYCTLAFGVVFVASLLVKKERIDADAAATMATDGEFADNPNRDRIVYTVLFAICLASIAGLVPYYVLLGIVLVACLINNRAILFDVDYNLLLTFVCFFVFIGNMKQMPEIVNSLSGLMHGRELLVGVVASQFISNVPAAILLSGFTANIKALIIATDIGGLGTIIASLASLISYRIYIKEKDSHGMQYMAVFTGMNVAFLAVMLLAALLII